MAKPKAQRPSSDYTSIDDLSLPRGATYVQLQEQHEGLERSNSDSHLNLISPQSWSSLLVDKTFFWLRGANNSNPDARVQVEWDIHDAVGAQDWIGLFHSGEEDTSKFLDCKTRGSSGGSKGAIFWDLDAVEHLFIEDKTVVCFKYISGSSGQVLATSPLISVILAKSDQADASKPSKDVLEHAVFCLTFEDVHATNLKKGVFFNPDPYIKIQVLPHNQKNQVQAHHYQEIRSSVKTNTAFPIWHNEKFSREVLSTDLVEIEVKHKFSRSRPTVSRFLGRCTLPVQTITDRIRQDQKCVQFNMELMRKSPSDNVSGTLGFKANLQLLLKGSSVTDNNHKSGSGLSRQTSLPASWMVTGEGTPHSSRAHMKHTESTPEVGSPLNSLCLGSENDMESDSLQAIGFNERNGCPEHSVDDGEVMTQSNDLTLARLQQSLTLCASEQTSEVVHMSSSLPEAGLLDLTKPKDSAVPNGQIVVEDEGAACRSTTRQYDLDMSVQSGQLSCSKGDAPLLPPRTYKAPPLPPRVYKTSPPPIPPRNNLERQRKKTLPQAMSLDVPSSASQDFPPPLPPRTYSPIDIHDSSDSNEGSAGASSSAIRDSLREQELFPWGMPTTPSDQQASPAAPASTNNPLASHLAMVPPVRPCAVGTPGSRGSVAWSTISDPPVPTSQMSEASGHSKRRSVDDINTSSQPPHLQPRQIRRHLEQWYREKQKASPTGASTPEEQLSPSSSLSTSHRELSETASSLPLPPPPLPPSLSPSTVRQLENSESSMAASATHTPGSNSMTQPSPPQPVVSSPSSSSAPPSLLPSTRDSSADRRLQNTDLAEGTRITRRPIKYHRVDDRDDALPSGWEARVDTHGRIFYIDHVNRTTTWLRPQTGLQAVQRRPTLSSEQRHQLNQRYQSIRRTITQSQQPESESTSSSDAQEPSASSVASDTNSSASNNSTERVPDRPADRSRHSVYKYPAVKFLTRPDFFPILQANETAMVDYNRNSKLKHMIVKIRRDPKAFERYQHNRDLVPFVNLFCDTSKELPPRWEMKYDRSGKPFFIDHVLRTTTFMDPRLPTDVPLINPEFLQTPAPRVRTASRSHTEGGAAPVPPPRQPLSPESGLAIPTAYNEKVVLFLRQPNIEDVLKDRSTQFSTSSSLRDKVTKIATRGVDMLERFSNDIDLTILLSLFENEIMSYIPPSSSRLTEPAGQGSPQGTPAQRAPGRVPAPYKRDFQAKLRSFYRKLESKGYGQGPGKLKLTVRRDHVLEDAFNKIMATPKKELQKNKLYITFAGEEGLDYGGPSREFFFLLSRELFNPYYGLFEYSANDTYTVQVSPSSTIVENAHEWFRFSGRVLGLALVHQYLLDAFFTRPFYKALLRVTLSLEDVESLDMEFHQSLLWIKDNDISEVDLGLTFSVSEEVFGQVTERELKPNGKNIPVNERNKKEYIEKMVKWRLERGVTEQTESLIRGFHEVLDSRQVSVFDARELELVIAGTVEIDIADWRRNTDYRSGYHDQDPVIQWFWEAIEKFDNERQLRLLQFVTGTSSIPYEGFSALRGSNGPRKFCIEKWGKVTSLPRAHTCFNRLDLPPYTSFEMLFEKLVKAVIETSTFSID